MARQYPRFLYSNPKNTKSEGPFIIHTLQPILLFKVEWGVSPNSFKLHLITNFFTGTIADNAQNELAARSWFQAQLDQKEVIWGS